MPLRPSIKPKKTGTRMLKMKSTQMIQKIKTNKEYNKKRYQDNKEHILSQQKEYRKRNNEKYLAYQIEYVKRRKKIDPAFKAAKAARNRIYNFMVGKPKFNSSLGCSFSEFKIYIESQFKPGMNWENYGHGNGKWVLDHKFPLAEAVKRGPEFFAKACKYTNLQPLWFEENLHKSDNIQDEHNL